MAIKPRSRAKKPEFDTLDVALGKVLEGKIPSIRGEAAFGIIKVVDPFEEREWQEGKRDAPPAAQIKVRALREDTIGRLHGRGQIDDAQHNAGRLWQELHHKAEIGVLKALDTTREAVDGGRLPEMLTESQQKAMREIARLDRALGQDGSALVRQILGHRMTIEQVAASRGYGSRDALAYFGRRFRECLERLAKELGLA